MKKNNTGKLFKYNFLFIVYLFSFVLNEDWLTKKVKNTSISVNTIKVFENNNKNIRLKNDVKYSYSSFLGTGVESYDRDKTNLFTYQPYVWTLFKPMINSKKPKERYYHSAGVFNNKMIVFGGSYLEELSFNDIWEYDFKSNKWSEVLTKGEIPSKRLGHSCVQYGDSFIIFGGTDNKLIFNTAFRLNLNTVSL